MTVKEDHNNIININDEISLTMKYPLISDFAGSTSSNDSDAAFELMKKCIESVNEGDKIHRRVDFTNDELDEFVDTLNTEQLAKIMKFFDTMPRLRHVVKVTNPKTKVESEVVIEGLANFLA